MDVVPWTTLFPSLAGTCGVIRDSQRRKNGDRHYRVKLRLDHSMVNTVRDKLKPYGFDVVVPWGTWDIRDKHGCIKCIRRTNEG